MFPKRSSNPEYCASFAATSRLGVPYSISRATVDRSAFDPLSIKPRQGRSKLKMYQMFRLHTQNDSNPYWKVHQKSQPRPRPSQRVEALVGDNTEARSLVRTRHVRRRALSQRDA